MAIEYLTGLNAIVMKAIWNIEKRQGRVIIQDLVEEIKRNTGKEYHRNSVSTYLHPAGIIPVYNIYNGRSGLRTALPSFRIRYGSTGQCIPDVCRRI